MRPAERRHTESCATSRTAGWWSVKSHACAPVPLLCQLLSASGWVDALPWVVFYRDYLHDSSCQSISSVFLLLNPCFRRWSYFLLVLVGEDSRISSLARDSHTRFSTKSVFVSSCSLSVWQRVVRFPSCSKWCFPKCSLLGVGERVKN